MIADRIDCDVYRIEAADPYSNDYDDTVARNVAEQNADARPRIAKPLPKLAAYDDVILASPIWNVRPPVIMSTFLDQVDLTGKRMFPDRHVCSKWPRPRGRGVYRTRARREDRPGPRRAGRRRRPERRRRPRLGQLRRPVNTHAHTRTQLRHAGRDSSPILPTRDAMPTPEPGPVVGPLSERHGPKPNGRATASRLPVSIWAHAA
jgi:Flavodoxin